MDFLTCSFRSFPLFIFPFLFFYHIAYFLWFFPPILLTHCIGVVTQIFFWRKNRFMMIQRILLEPDIFLVLCASRSIRTYHIPVSPPYWALYCYKYKPFHKSCKYSEQFMDQPSACNIVSSICTIFYPSYRGIRISKRLLKNTGMSTENSIQQLLNLSI